MCGVSDNIYRYLQALAFTIVGKQNYEDYAPLIAGGILRVRLELCVLESFVNEAIVPFVREKGLSWVLPFHETVETFLAGTVFAVATNFILLGSTKVSPPCSHSTSCSLVAQSRTPLSHKITSE